MEGIALLEAAERAGLRVFVEGDELVVRGSSTAGALARQLIEHKTGLSPLLVARGQEQLPAATWTMQTKLLLDWFSRHIESLPRGPFQLRPAERVADPKTFYAALVRDIANGPAGPRAVMGGLQSDLQELQRRVAEVSKQDI
jgi:hypothetical protein